MTALSPLIRSIRENDAMGTKRYLSFQAFSRYGMWISRREAHV
jgi:hypothetical protein